MSTELDIDRAQQLLANVREHVHALVSYSPEPHEWPDAVADCRELERRLAEWRQNLEKAAAEMNRIDQPRPTERVSEFDQRAGKPVLQGDRYELVPKHKNVYTFNDPAILSTVAEALDVSIVEAVLALLEPIVSEGKKNSPLSMSWRISYLRSFCVANGITLPEAKGSTSNDDGLDGPPVAVNRVPDGVTRVAIK